MLHDPESTYRIALRRREDELKNRRLHAQLRAARIDTGPRPAIATALRGLADRVDDMPTDPAASHHRPQPGELVLSLHEHVRALHHPVDADEHASALSFRVAIQLELYSSPHDLLAEGSVLEDLRVPEELPKTASL